MLNDKTRVTFISIVISSVCVPCMAIAFMLTDNDRLTYGLYLVVAVVMLAVCMLRNRADKIWRSLPVVLYTIVYSVSGWGVAKRCAQIDGAEAVLSLYVLCVLLCIKAVTHSLVGFRDEEREREKSYWRELRIGCISGLYLCWVFPYLCNEVLAKGNLYPGWGFIFFEAAGLLFFINFSLMNCPDGYYMNLKKVFGQMVQFAVCLGISIPLVRIISRRIDGWVDTFQINLIVIVLAGIVLFVVRMVLIHLAKDVKFSYEHRNDIEGVDYTTVEEGKRRPAVDIFKFADAVLRRDYLKKYLESSYFISVQKCDEIKSATDELRSYYDECEIIEQQDVREEAQLVRMENLKEDMYNLILWLELSAY